MDTADIIGGVIGIFLIGAGFGYYLTRLILGI